MSLGFSVLEFRFLGVRVEGLGSCGLGLGCRDITPITENQLEKRLEYNMETMIRFVSLVQYGSPVWVLITRHAPNTLLILQILHGRNLLECGNSQGIRSLGSCRAINPKPFYYSP